MPDESSKSKWSGFLQIVGQIIIYTALFTCLVFAEMKFVQLGHEILGTVLTIIVFIFVSPKKRLPNTILLIVIVVSGLLTLPVTMALMGAL